ncbi:ATP-binding protein [Pseudoalteromonas espejiana]
MHHLESDLLIPANEKNINLEIINNIDHNNWIGDPVRLRQIFLNLISNAIKFTNEGSVSMQVSLKGEDTLSFKVSDTGIGISQQALERLFERFEQADKSTTREYGGSGLGLAITQSLVELMNGTISVSSQLGSGSQFTVTLPLVKAQASAVKANEAALALPSLTNKTVLIAEDNKINQLVASSFMEATGANIIIANNGIEAVELYEIHAPDIILMDIQMPKMNGLEACKIIKNKHSEQLIIALTANVLSEQKRLYAQLFDGYISKPIEKHELIKALQSVGF